MYLETARLIIKDLDESMAASVHLNSLDGDNRRFLPDEVFESPEEALSAIRHLISCYQSQDGPFVYAVLLKTGHQIGHVQLVKIREGWEIGFHTGQAYGCQGYATEAVKAYLPFIMDQVDTPVIYGICDQENLASRKVMEKCGFLLAYEGIDSYQGEERPICKYLLADPGRIEDLVGRLMASDDQEAYRSMKKLEAVSREADAVYPFLGSFFTMLNHANSYIRTRGLILIAANARWDQQGQIDGIIDAYLEHIMDPSPITARQCIKVLPLMARHRPGLRSRIVNALERADHSNHQESMRELLGKDIDQALNRLGEEASCQL
ncbi:MAG: GNAT family N-acetyltransferase [Clostridiaceae bacterium]|nr:GNAT family N-acetyltransferase [Clostridiaceae bacterium]